MVPPILIPRRASIGPGDREAVRFGHPEKRSVIAFPAARFEVEFVPEGVRIRYELDLLYLLIWTAVVATFAGMIGLIALAEGSYSTLALFAGFFAVAVPLNYAFYASRTKALFRGAARGVTPC